MKPARCAQRKTRTTTATFPIPIEQLRADLPELPDAKRARFGRDWGLAPYDAAVLVADQPVAAYYETVAAGRDPKLAANWVIGDLFSVLNKDNLAITDSPVPAIALGGLLDLITDGTINGKIAKEVFEAMVATGDTAAAVVEAGGLRQVVDTGAIDTAIAGVLAANGEKLAEYHAGKDKLFGFFVGQVMKAMAGRGNPALVNDALKRALTSN